MLKTLTAVLGLVRSRNMDMGYGQLWYSAKYRTAGNFWGRKLSRIGEKHDSRGENFRRLLACAVPKDATPPNFAEKTFVNSHKTAKFAKVFFLKRFPLYSSICHHVRVSTTLIMNSMDKPICLIPWLFSAFCLLLYHIASDRKLRIEAIN